MYVILDKANKIIFVSETFSYVKTQPNGTTILAAAHDATAGYCGENDTFYSLRENTPGEAIYSVAEVQDAPQGIPFPALLYEDGRVVVDNEMLHILQLSEIETRLLAILDQERLDEACGIIKSVMMSFGISERDNLIAERNRLKQLVKG